MSKLTKFTTNVNNIQGLSDEPNTIDGLTSQQLKEKFDKAGSDIKEYLNETLIPELEKEVSSDEYVKSNDSRLTDSRKCNNSYDNPLIARENLKIKYGNVLPEDAEDGTIFFLYQE